MSSFDPSIISQIPDGLPNPAEAIGRGIQLKDLANTQQLNQLRLNEVKKSQADEQKAAEIFKTSKYDTQKGVYDTMEKLTRAGLQKQALEFGSMAQKYQTGEVEQETKILQRDSAEHDVISGSLDSVMSRLNDLKDRGATPAELDAAAANFAMPEMNRLAAQYKDNPRILERIRGFAGDPKNLSYQGIDAAERQSNKGQQLMKERLAERKQGEIERENSARDDRGERALGLQQKKEKNRESASETGAFDESSLNDMAQQYLAGDKSVFTGVGRGAQGAKNIVNLRKAISQQAQAQGVAPKEIATKIAEYNGLMAEERAVGVRQGAIEIASTEAEKVIPIALEASRNVPRGQFVPLNKLIQGYKVNTSDPKLAAFAQANLTLSNVYARAITPTGTPAEGSRQEALKRLSEATSQEAYESVVGIMEKEIKAARASPPKVRADIRESINREYKSGPTPGNAPDAAVQYLKANPQFKEQFKQKYGYVPDGN